MKQLYGKLWVKCTAIALLIVFAVLLAASALGIAYLINYGAYADGGEQVRQIAENNLLQQTNGDGWAALHAWAEDDTVSRNLLRDRYDPLTSNIYFKLTDKATGEILFSTGALNKDDYSGKASAYYQQDMTTLLSDGSEVTAVYQAYLKSPLAPRDSALYVMTWVERLISARYLLIALAILIFSDDAKRTAIIPAVVAVIFIGISCVSYVPTGYTGIVTTFGKVEDGTKDAGVVLKAPWQSIVKMDNRVQEMSMDLSAFSSDIQEVSTSVAVGYRINQANAMTIYKEVGKKYEDTLITPRVLETVKAVVAHYDASSLISNRDAVASQMDTKLREVLAQYNIDLQYISVTNFDFTDTFTDAVEAKVKAQQEKEKAETDADKRRVEAQATADADLIAANAEAEKSKVAADAELYVAEKKAEANRALNDSLNSNLLEYYKITDVESRWNGELPAYVGDGNSIPIINGIN